MTLSRRSRVWLAGLAALLVTIVDLRSDPGHTLGALYSVLPLLAAINGTAVAVAVAGTVGLVLSVLMSWYNDDLWHVNGIAGILTVLAATVIALWAHHTRLAREQRLTHVTRVADAVQQALLPEPAARIGPYTVAASYAAAADEAQIGGDFYKIIQTRYGIRGVIGDVRGHGLGVVRITALILGVFHEAAHEEERLEEIAARVDRSLERDAGMEGFATMLVFAVSEDGVWTGLNFGHPYPLLRTATGAVREVEVPSGPPVGLGLPAMGTTPKEVDVTLAEGDELLLTTDGALEARDADGAFFPLAERLAEAPRECPPAAVLTRLRQDLDAWAPQIGDDSALMLLRYTS